VTRKKSESSQRCGRVFKTADALSLAEYVTAAHAPASGKLNDTEPKFFSEFNTLVADTPIDHIKTYLRWHLLHAYAGASLPEAFDHENGISIRTF